LVFFSGLGAVDEEGNYLSQDFGEQMQITLNMLASALDAAGIRWEEVVSVRCYVQNPNDLSIYNRIYADWFSAPFPARATFTGCLPPGLLFELEAVAVRGCTS
jgi:2-iminobutanoate/2-iminopropanoate deaminase